eukprot:CAMPEP_0204091452 /NCGR_PEP_ID=MMETSP0360-20130528/189412_1 /ASSEMBLY_ACC=CAM_ASM_000342 /TAXON_ID=268821 /ORGANISM="Scrippsiella Hangoei, Strain SHTV-5" /LENGTH=265 /DNA_ID=CAMNT_0051040717 /DNA_START=90 /DNA_END=889 /DNA_ORIENTATION=-
MTCGTLNAALLFPGQHELGELNVQEEPQPDLRLHRWLGISTALIACMLVAASLSPMRSDDPALQGSAVGHILSLASSGTDSPETTSPSHESACQEEPQPDLRLHRWLGISTALMACMLVAPSLSPIRSDDPALQGSAVGHILSLTSSGTDSPETSFTIPRKCVYAMLGGAIVGVFGTLLAGPILSLFGFGVAGVTSGSLAALWQASMGSIAAGSLFAVLQSVAAAGLGFTGAAVVTGSAAKVRLHSAQAWTTCATGASTHDRHGP